MSEYIDVYDKDRNKTGKVVDRKTYFLKENEYMMYVLALIENDQNQFLVTKRSMNKKWAAGFLEVPGGGAIHDETSIEAVIREAKEETGLELSESLGKCIYTYFNEDLVRGDNYFVDIYHFKLDFDPNAIKLSEKETNAYYLMTLADINEHKDHFLHYKRILQALKQAHYEHF